MPLPKAIANAPELLLGLEFYWTAFWELSSCRPVGFGFGPIPWTVIIDYAAAFEVEPDDVSDFIYLIRAMDKAWIDWQVANQPKSDSKSRPAK